MGRPIYASDQANYADEVRHKLEAEEGWHVTDMEKEAIQSIANGAMIDDYCSVHHRIWHGILAVYILEPSDPRLETNLHSDTGCLLTGAIAIIKWNCKLDVNPVTRACGLRALVHIFMWLSELTNLTPTRPPDPYNREPFWPLFNGPHTCLEVAEGAIIEILRNMPEGERRLIHKDMLHVNVKAALEALRALVTAPEYQVYPRQRALVLKGLIDGFFRWEYWDS